MAENSRIENRKVIASNGYVLVRVGKAHHLADCRGYAYEHRLVAEQKLGRRLNKGEMVHHINGNKQNNAPENLEVCESAAEHLLHHRKRITGRRLPRQENVEVKCACGCGGSFLRFDEYGRPREYLSGHNQSPNEKRTSVIRLARERGVITIGMVEPLLSSRTAAKVMLSRLFAENLLTRKGRGVYGAKD